MLPPEWLSTLSKELTTTTRKKQIEHSGIR